MEADEQLSRREFLKKGAHHLWQQVMAPSRSIVSPLRQRRFLRPPGAREEGLFLSLCTRCDACTAACPHEALSVHYGSGAPHDGTPVLANLRKNPCLLCEDMPCIAACPTDALVMPESTRQVKIGVAVLDQLDCSAFRGSGCSDCHDRCPVEGAIELRENLPFVQEDICTGCGICQQVCPEEPEAIRVIPAES